MGWAVRGRGVASLLCARPAGCGTSVRMAAQLYMIIVSPLTGQTPKIFFPEISDLDILALRAWWVWVVWRFTFPSRRRP